MLVFAAVNDRTTGTGRLAPSANCGVPTTATVATTIGTVTAIANFERTLKWNMDSLASSIRRGWWPATQTAFVWWGHGHSYHLPLDIVTLTTNYRQEGASLECFHFRGRRL